MSPKPILYYNALSPPCRSVTLTAAAIDVDLELRQMEMLKGEHLKAEYVKVLLENAIV